RAPPRPPRQTPRPGMAGGDGGVRGRRAAHLRFRSPRAAGAPGAALPLPLRLPGTPDDRHPPPSRAARPELLPLPRLRQRTGGLRVSALSLARLVDLA